MCNDMASAVGNDINTPAIELAKVSGPGHAAALLSGVTWTDVRQSTCMALLREAPEDVSGVIVDRSYRSCRRSGILTLPLSSTARIFGSLNLAAFALVGVGVTSILILFYISTF